MNHKTMNMKNPAVQFALVGIVLAIGWFGIRWITPTPSATPNMPSHTFDDGHLRDKEATLSELARQYLAEPRNADSLKLAKKYDPLIAQVIGDDASPEDLAVLAIWAHRQEPNLILTDCKVYTCVCLENVGRLGRMKGERARNALRYVKTIMEHDGVVDGAVGLAFYEAERIRSKSCLS